MENFSLNHISKCAYSGCTYFLYLIRFFFIALILFYVFYPMFLFFHSNSYLVKFSVTVYFTVLYFWGDVNSIFKNTRNKLGITNLVLENNSLCVTGIYGPALILIISAYFS